MKSIFIITIISACTFLLRTRHESLPLIQPFLSIGRPIIFFHQRKCGGSSVRLLLRRAAKTLNISSFIPCHDGISCDTYTMGSHKAVVYAGHFPWGVQKEFQRHASGIAPNKTHFSCITMFRDPIARIISCYYYRFVNELKIGEKYNSCIGNISVLQLKNVLINGRTKYGLSCLNEPFRIMSGILDEDIVHNVHNLPYSIRSNALQTALRNVQSCIPLFLSRQVDNAIIMKHWIPSLNWTHIPSINKGFTWQQCKIPVGHLSLLKELTSLEHVLFTAAGKRFNLMLGIARKSRMYE